MAIGEFGGAPAATGEPGEDVDAEHEQDPGDDRLGSLGRERGQGDRADERAHEAWERSRTTTR